MIFLVKVLMQGVIKLTGSSNLVFSALSLIYQAEIGNTGVVIENNGVSKVTNAEGNNVIFMNLSVKIYKNVLEKSILRLVKRWVDMKVSAITSDSYSIDCEYNKEEQIYEVSIKFK